MKNPLFGWVDGLDVNLSVVYKYMNGHDHLFGQRGEGHAANNIFIPFGLMDHRQIETR